MKLKQAEKNKQTWKGRLQKLDANAPATLNGKWPEKTYLQTRLKLVRLRALREQAEETAHYDYR